MKRRPIIAAVALFACAAVASCAPGIRFSPRTLEQDEREVVLAVIRHLEAEGEGSSPVIVTLTQHEIPNHLRPDAEVLKEVEIRFPLEVFPDVVERSRARVPLASLIGDSAGVRWITPAQVDWVFAARGESIHAPKLRLGEIHPGAESFVSFSRVGFDEPRTHAALMYGAWCGDLCGSAGFVLLDRRSGRWRVVDWRPMLVS